MEKEIFKVLTVNHPDQDAFVKAKSAKEISEHVFKFVEWYSGMERQKIINAYNRYLKEHPKE
jgi:hypothetical protein